MIEAGKTAVVMGLGISGCAAVRYLHAKGMRVAVSDVRQKKELSSQEHAFLNQYTTYQEFGGHTEQFLKQASFLLISPGISPHIEIVARVRDAGVPVVGELALAAADIKTPVVAVTGTNGKTTVTSLIGELLVHGGKKVFVGGNIGTPLLDYLRNPYDADVLVLELSSFQLEVAGEFRADVALLLNITPDHLDRHDSLENYGLIKMKIFDNQRQKDLSIISADDLVCSELRKQSIEKDFLLFGHLDGCHARIEGNHICVADKIGKDKFDLSSTGMANHIGCLNSAAAILAVRAFGCSNQQIMEGLRAFNSLPHRMEWVEEINGVNYYNDSKATNSGAVVSALNQLDGPVILILGGRDKGDDYSLLIPDMEKKVSLAIVIGEAKEKITAALDGRVTLQQADSLEQAVRLAHLSAQPGHTVLLSPACASFDMFESYGHRGEVFKDLVMAIQREYFQEGTGV